MGDNAQAVQELANAVDAAAGLAAGIAAYVAHLPGAASADVEAIKSYVGQIVPMKTSAFGTHPIVHANRMIDKISELARAVAQSGGR